MIRPLKWATLGALCGILAGVAASVFLILLDWVTETRLAHPMLVWFLPLGGFFIGWLYHEYGQNIAAGHNLILDEIHNPKNVVPARMSPFVLLGTLVSHFFGASVGREGAAVQISASLADQLTHPFKLTPAERRTVLVAGTGAGFGAAIGAPWAGVLFGMEVVTVGRLKPVAPIESLIASFVAYYTARLLRAPHSHFPVIALPGVSIAMVLIVVAAGVLCGLLARGFTLFTHGIENLRKKWIPYPPLSPFFGGLILLALYQLSGSYRYSGLGIDVIQEALTRPVSWADPLLKGAYTALSVGTGFKGGEFVPLVFMGTTLGSYLATWLPATAGFLGALGFAALFGGAANTPLACTIMAGELFGWGIAPYAFIACLASYFCSGRSGIYRGQR